MLKYRPFGVQQQSFILAYLFFLLLSYPGIYRRNDTGVEFIRLK